MSASTSVGNAILNCYLRGTAITPPTRVYASLHTADPGNTGASEVGTGAWPSYIRVDPAGGAAMTTGFSAAASKATTNLKDLIFAANDGAAPISVSHVGLWDAPTGGNFLFAAPVVDGVGAPTTKSFLVGDEGVLHPGDFDFAVT